MSINAISLKEAIAETEAEILHALGIDNTKCACPVHMGDNPTGFSYSLERRSWACWTHHCEETYGADIIGLVRGVRRCSFHEAISWIVETLKINPDNLDLSEAKRKQYIRRQHAKKTRQTNNKIFDIRPFLAASGGIEYFKKRGFNDDVIKEFGCFTCLGVPKQLYNRAVISVRNTEGKTIALSARQLDDNENFSKWLFFPDSVNKMSIVGGLYESLRKYPGDTITVTEGYFDVMKIYQAGFPACTVLGTNISLLQIRQLMLSGIKNVYLMMDPDAAGKSAAQKLHAKLNRFFNVIDLTDTLPDDPGDLSTEQLQDILCKR